MVGGPLCKRYINRGGGRGTGHGVHRCHYPTDTTKPDLGLALCTGSATTSTTLCPRRLSSPPLPPAMAGTSSSSTQGEESAVMCLDLPSSISMAADLTEAAKKFLSKRYKEFLSPKFQDELMRIPLAGIEAILSRNNLKVASEVAMYDFVLKWAFSQYPDSEERHKILSSRLLPLVSLVRYTSVATILGLPHCSVNFCIKREKCSLLFPSGSIRSLPFRCAGHGLCLLAHRSMEPSDCFGRSIEMLEDKGPVRGTMHYKFDAKTIPSHEFVTKYEGSFTSDSREAVRSKNLFGVPWSEFIADDNRFFINGVLHLRVYVKIQPEP